MGYERINKPIKTLQLDTSSGVVMPFYDNDTKMLYLAGKVVFWIRFCYERTGRNRGTPRKGGEACVLWFDQKFT
jgi:hypothetical protein